MSDILRAIVMIGIPGSGKSTYIRQELAIVPNQQIVCPDDIRLELTGDARDQSLNTEVWAIAYEKAKEALLAGKVLIFDATNTKKVDRLALLTHIRSVTETEIFVKGIWLRTPLDICKKRNANRQRNVPETALERMYYQLEAEPPRQDEGFSQVYVTGC